MPKPPPYVAFQVAHDEGIAREARLTMQALKLAREMEAGIEPEPEEAECAPRNLLLQRPDRGRGRR